MRRPLPIPSSQAPRSAGERALDHFLAAGFERTEPPILHPAAIFLDMSGEEVRRRLFLTAGAAGEELCLRPEYTIPVCRAYLASDRAGAIAEYSYLGPVFRARAGQGGEQTQTGLESFGRKDAEAADAEVFALALRRRRRREAARSPRGSATRASSTACSNSLEIPDVWRRRLRRGVARGRGLDAIFNRPSQGALAQAGVLAALESADHAGAKALVEDLLAIAGIEAVGGRSAGEIADRFLEQASLRSGEPIEAEKRAVLEAFLAISGDPDEAAIELRRLAESARLDLAAALDAFETAQRLHRRPGRRDRGDPLQRRLRARLRLLHRLRVRGARSRCSGREDRARRRTLRRARAAPRRGRGHSRRRRRDHARPARERGRALMALDPRQRR